MGRSRASEQVAYIDLKPTDFSRIKFDAKGAIFARPGSGKSTAMRNIVPKIKEATGCYRWVLFSGNKENAVSWSKLIPPLFIHFRKDLRNLYKIKNYQEERFARVKQEFIDAGGIEKDFECPDRLKLIVVVDDMGSYSEVMHDPIFVDFVNNARHYGIGLWQLLQRVTQWHPDCRHGLNYCGIMHTDTDSVIDMIYRDYAPKTMTRWEFDCAFADCTKEWGEMLWLDNYAKGHKKLSFYSPPSHPPRLEPVSRRLQLYHMKHYVSQRVKDTLNKRPIDDEGEDSPDEEQDEQEAAMTRKLRQINGPIFAQQSRFERAGRTLQVRRQVHRSTPSSIRRSKVRMGKYD